MRTASSGAPLLAFLAVISASRALDRERGAHRALSVDLLRVRVVNNAVIQFAELLQYMATQFGHRRRSLVAVSVDEVAPVFGVKPRGKTGRPDEIAEHNRNRAALSLGA